ncbi:Rz1-like lysis system protein LysC [Stutzerimonas zhaodongensis]|uniref:Rz1-like lysis system protein LysC n=1 Tax=Stutzerimonas zhaodongensis TaxID=1176257 RepID=UPI0039F0E402
MKTPNYVNGLLSCCLMLLAGCGSVPPSPAPTVIAIGCPAVTPCSLPPAKPSSNGELLADADALETAWAACAAQVDMVYAHQQKQAQP